ncbi:MAG: hypothetical protein J0653_01915 [Deltaproteobacteria bacterium]|nr:hypothetical protein [Deltaproteobacteria bacterium]
MSIQCQYGEEFYLNCPPEATHIINNEPVTIIPEPVIPPPPTEAEIIASLTQAVQARLDSEARTHNYDGILSLCSYVTSLDPVFKAEGQAGVEWRDACWRTAYQVMADVKAGMRGVPTSEELVAELTTMEWPTV